MAAELRERLSTRRSLLQFTEDDDGDPKELSRSPEPTSRKRRPSVENLRNASIVSTSKFREVEDDRPDSGRPSITGGQAAAAFLAAQAAFQQAASASVLSRQGLSRRTSLASAASGPVLDDDGVPTPQRCVSPRPPSSSVSPRPPQPPQVCVTPPDSSAQLPLPQTTMKVLNPETGEEEEKPASFGSLKRFWHKYARDNGVEDAEGNAKQAYKQYTTTVGSDQEVASFADFMVAVKSEKEEREAREAIDFKRLRSVFDKEGKLVQPCQNTPIFDREGRLVTAGTPAASSGQATPNKAATPRADAAWHDRCDEASVPDRPAWPEASQARQLERGPASSAEVSPTMKALPPPEELAAQLAREEVLGKFNISSSEGQAQAEANFGLQRRSLDNRSAASSPRYSVGASPRGSVEADVAFGLLTRTQKIMKSENAAGGSEPAVAMADRAAAQQAPSTADASWRENLEEASPRQRVEWQEGAAQTPGRQERSANVAAQSSPAASPRTPQMEQCASDGAASVSSMTGIAPGNDLRRITFSAPSGQFAVQPVMRSPQASPKESPIAAEKPPPSEWLSDDSRAPGQVSAEESSAGGGQFAGLRSAGASAEFGHPEADYAAASGKEACSSPQQAARADASAAGDPLPVSAHANAVQSTQFAGQGTSHSLHASSEQEAPDPVSVLPSQADVGSTGDAPAKQSVLELASSFTGEAPALHAGAATQTEGLRAGAQVDHSGQGRTGGLAEPDAKAAEVGLQTAEGQAQAEASFALHRRSDNGAANRSAAAGADSSNFESASHGNINEVEVGGTEETVAKPSVQQLASSFAAEASPLQAESAAQTGGVQSQSQADHSRQGIAEGSAGPSAKATEGGLQAADEHGRGLQRLSEGGSTAHIAASSADVSSVREASTGSTHQADVGSTDEQPVKQSVLELASSFTGDSAPLPAEVASQTGDSQARAQADYSSQGTTGGLAEPSAKAAESGVQEGQSQAETSAGLQGPSGKGVSSSSAASGADASNAPEASPATCEAENSPEGRAPTAQLPQPADTMAAPAQTGTTATEPRLASETLATGARSSPEAPGHGRSSGHSPESAPDSSVLPSRENGPSAAGNAAATPRAASGEGKADAGGLAASPPAPSPEVPEAAHYQEADTEAPAVATPGAMSGSGDVQPHAKGPAAASVAVQSSLDPAAPDPSGTSTTCEKSAAAGTVPATSSGGAAPDQPSSDVADAVEAGGRAPPEPTVAQETAAAAASVQVHHLDECPAVADKAEGGTSVADKAPPVSADELAPDETLPTANAGIAEDVLRSDVAATGSPAEATTGSVATPTADGMPSNPPEEAASKAASATPAQESTAGQAGVAEVGAVQADAHARSVGREPAAAVPSSADEGSAPERPSSEANAGDGPAVADVVAGAEAEPEHHRSADPEDKINTPPVKAADESLVATSDAAVVNSAATEASLLAPGGDLSPGAVLPDAGASPIEELSKSAATTSPTADGVSAPCESLEAASSERGPDTPVHEEGAPHTDAAGEASVQAEAPALSTGEEPAAAVAAPGTSNERPAAGRHPADASAGDLAVADVAAGAEAESEPALTLEPATASAPGPDEVHPAAGIDGTLQPISSSAANAALQAEVERADDDPPMAEATANVAMAAESSSLALAGAAEETSLHEHDAAADSGNVEPGMRSGEQTDSAAVAETPNPLASVGDFLTGVPLPAVGVEPPEELARSGVEPDKSLGDRADDSAPSPEVEEVEPLPVPFLLASALQPEPECAASPEGGSSREPGIKLTSGGHTEAQKQVSREETQEGRVTTPPIADIHASDLCQGGAYAVEPNEARVQTFAESQEGSRRGGPVCTNDFEGGSFVEYDRAVADEDLEPPDNEPPDPGADVYTGPSLASRADVPRLQTSLLESSDEEDNSPGRLTEPRVTHPLLQAPQRGPRRPSVSTRIRAQSPPSTESSWWWFTCCCRDRNNVR